MLFTGRKVDDIAHSHLSLFLLRGHDAYACGYDQNLVSAMSMEVFPAPRLKFRQPQLKSSDMPGGRICWPVRVTAPPVHPGTGLMFVGMGSSWTSLILTTRIFPS